MIEKLTPEGRKNVAIEVTGPRSTHIQLGYVFILVTLKKKKLHKIEKN